MLSKVSYRHFDWFSLQTSSLRVCLCLCGDWCMLLLKMFGSVSWRFTQHLGSISATLLCLVRIPPSAGSFPEQRLVMEPTQHQPRSQGFSYLQGKSPGNEVDTTPYHNVQFMNNSQNRTLASYLPNKRCFFSRCISPHARQCRYKI